MRSVWFPVEHLRLPFELVAKPYQLPLRFLPPARRGLPPTQAGTRPRLDQRAERCFGGGQPRWPTRSANAAGAWSWAFVASRMTELLGLVAAVAGGEPAVWSELHPADRCRGSASGRLECGLAGPAVRLPPELEKRIVLPAAAGPGPLRGCGGEWIQQAGQRSEAAWDT